MKSAKLLESGFQLKFWMKFCVITAGGFGALALCLYLATGRDLGGSYGEAMYTIYALRINIFSLIVASVYSIAIMVLTVVFIALATIFFSHKMAGPIFHLTRDLELIASGDLSVETSFRRSDQFALVAMEKNKMTARLKGLVTESRDDLEAVKKCSANLGVLLGGLDEDGGRGPGTGGSGGKGEKGEKGEQRDLDGEISEGLAELGRLVDVMSSRVLEIKTS
ncbi:MAG: hypothetical protein ACE5EZ_00815 [Thermodesulfobacteriota bacterium]